MEPMSVEDAKQQIEAALMSCEHGYRRFIAAEPGSEQEDLADLRWHAARGAHALAVDTLIAAAKAEGRAEGRREAAEEQGR